MLQVQMQAQPHPQAVTSQTVMTPHGVKNVPMYKRSSKSKKTAGNATDKTGDKAGDKTGDDDTASADVVSLDAFRKKP